MKKSKISVIIFIIGLIVFFSTIVYRYLYEQPPADFLIILWVLNIVIIYASIVAIICAFREGGWYIVFTFRTTPRKENAKAWGTVSGVIIIIMQVVSYFLFHYINSTMIIIATIASAIIMIVGGAIYNDDK